MRPRLRAAAFFALSLVTIQCTDGPTGPKTTPSPATGMSAGRVSLAPSFSAEATRAFGALAAFGVDVTEVHVRLTATDGSTQDTTVPFPATQDTLVLEIPVSVQGTDQPFTALIELRNDQHVVLFSGTQVVIARAGNTPVGPPSVVTIQYTGPGRGTRTVTLGPPDTTVASSAVLPFTATALDSSGKPVTDLLVRWTSSDSTLATVTPTSNAAATVRGLGRRGTTTISATTPQGVAGTARVTLVPSAARVVLISGGAQTGVAGSTLAQSLVVEVQAADNLPVPGAPVVFRAMTTGSGVKTVTTVTDAQGRASTALTLGPTAGVYQFEAASGTLTPVSASATATAAPAVALAILSGDAQVDSLGRALAQPLVVKVTDQFGGAVNGATVTWTQSAGTGTLGATTSLTSSNGTASTTYTLGNVVGFDTVRASVAGVSSSVAFSLRTIGRGPALIAILSGGGQTGAQGATLPAPLVARVTDALNNPVPNANVVWGASANTATFTPTTSVTGSNGQASTVVTLGSVAGPVTLTASAGGTIVAATFVTVTGTAPVATQIAMTINPPAAAVSGQVLTGPPTVVLKDAFNNVVAQPNDTITASLSSSGGTLSGTLSVPTSTSGTAAFTNLVITGPAGPYNLVFSARGGLTPAVSSTITLSSGATLQTKVGTRLSIDPVGVTNPSTAPVFVAKNGAGAPLVGQSVTITAFGRCLLDNGSLLVPRLSINTDAIGEVRPLVRLPSGAVGAGCVIRASAGVATDSSMLAVYPANMTHVWTGLGAPTNVAWNSAANWQTVNRGAGAPTLATDRAFVPLYPGISNPPYVSGSRPSVAQVALDTSAVVNLNALGIDVGSGGVTGMGIFINGVVHLQATATLNGVFDQVDIGQSGTCGSVAPMMGTLGFASANNLNVYCRTLIDTTAAAALNVNIFPNAGGNGWLTINARGALSVSNNANFTGDSLYVLGGVISVNGSATMGGSRVLFGNGSTLSVQGPAFFNATVGGDYTNAQILVQGNVLVGGGVSGQQSFSGGYFQAGGNFTQTAGALSQTLRTSNDHRIQFLSTAPQVLSVASPASTFQLLEFNNGSAGGVQLASDITIVNGTLQARVDVMRGNLNVTTGTTLSVGGGMLRLGTGANLNLNGNVANVSTCYGRTLNNATLSGTGLFNNAPYTAATCTP